MLSRGLWRVRNFPWIREAAVTCTRNISVRGARASVLHTEICVQSISGALYCAEGMDGWLLLGRPRSPKLGP